MSETPRGRAISALAEHAPENGIAELRELGSGLDHHTFVVDGLVVRVADAADASGEAGLLVLIARRSSLPGAGRGAHRRPAMHGKPLMLDDRGQFLTRTGRRRRP